MADVTWEAVFDHRQALAQMRQMQAGLDDLAARYNRVRTAAHGMGGRVDRTGKSLDRAARSGQAASRSMGSLGIKSGLASAGVAAAGASVLAFAAASVKAVQGSTELEASITRVVAVSGMATESYGEFERAAISAGLRSAFSASQAAGAMEEMGVAGFEVEETTAGLVPVLQLAAAAKVEVADAASVATGSMRAFGLQVEDLDHINNVLLNTMTSSKVRLDDLRDGMKTVGAVAKASGQDIEVTAAAIGLMGDASLPGAQSARMLRMGLLRLQKPTKEVTQTLEKLGVVTRNATGGMRELPDIVQELQDAGATIEDMAALFGTESVAGFQVLVDRGADAIDTFAESNREVKDLAKNMEALQLDTVSGQFQIMTGTVDTLLARAGGLSSELQKGVLKDFNQFAASSQTVEHNLSLLDQIVTQNEKSWRHLTRQGFAKAVGVMDLLVRNAALLSSELNKLESSTTSVGKAFSFLVDIDRTAQEWIPTFALLNSALEEVDATAGTVMEEFERMDRAEFLEDVDRIENHLKGMAERTAFRFSRVGAGLVEGIAAMSGIETTKAAFEKQIKGLEGALEQTKDKRMRAELKHQLDILRIQRRGLPIEKEQVELAAAKSRHEKALKMASKRRSDASRKGNKFDKEFFTLKLALLNATTLEQRELIKLQLAEVDANRQGLKGIERELFLVGARKKIEAETTAVLDRRQIASMNLGIIQETNERVRVRLEYERELQRIEFSQLEGMEKQEARARAALELREQMTTIAEREARAMKRAAEEQKRLDEEAERRRMRAVQTEVRKMEDAASRINAAFGSLGESGIEKAIAGFGGLTGAAAQASARMMELQAENASMTDQLLAASGALGPAFTNAMDQVVGATSAASWVRSFFAAGEAALMFASGNIAGGISASTGAVLHGAAAAASGMQGATPPSASAGGSSFTGASSNSTSGVNIERQERMRARFFAEEMRREGGGTQQTVEVHVHGPVLSSGSDTSRALSDLLTSQFRADGIPLADMAVVHRRGR